MGSTRAGHHRGRRGGRRGRAVRPPWVRVVAALALAVALAVIAAALAGGPVASAGGRVAAGTGPVAADDAGVTGKVVNGTNGEPAAAIEVTLFLYDERSGVGSLSTTADDAGAFAFPALPPEVTAFQVAATFDGAEYRTRVFPADRRAPVRLTVFEPTTSPDAVVVATWVVWIDREGEAIAIQHDLRWRNDGDAAYVGSGGGGPVRLPLAPGARGFQYLGAFLERPGRIEGGAFLHPAPIVPGETRATLRYTADPPARLTFPVTLPTERFDLLVPEGIGVTSDRLTPAGEVTDRGIAYRVFTSSGLSPGEEIVVTLSGLSGGGTASVLAPLLVGVGLAAALGGAFTLRRGAGRRRAGPGAARARSSAGRDRGRHGPARPAPRASAREPARNAPDAAPPDEVDLLIDEIAALDLAHERGLLAPDAYRRLRATAKARLMRLRAERGGAGSEREEGSGCS